MPCSQHGMDPKFKVGETPKACSSQDTVLPSSKRPTSAAFVLPETVCLEGPCYNARLCHLDRLIMAGCPSPESRVNWLSSRDVNWKRGDDVVKRGETKAPEKGNFTLFKVSLEDNFGGEDGIPGQNLVYRKGQMCAREQMV